MRVLHFSVAARRAAHAGCVPCALTYYGEGNDFLWPLADKGAIGEKIGRFWVHTHQTMSALLERKMPDISNRPTLPRPATNNGRVPVQPSTSGYVVARAVPKLQTNKEDSPVTRIRTIRPGHEFPEYHNRADAVCAYKQTLYTLGQYHKIPIPTGAKQKFPIKTTSIADGCAIGFHPTDQFFNASVRAERIFFANEGLSKEIFNYRPDARAKLQVLILHDSCFQSYRFTQQEKYYQLASGVNVPTNVKEDFLPPEVEVFQLYANVDLTDPAAIHQVWRMIESIKYLGKRFHLFVVNSFNGLFSMASGTTGSSTSPDYCMNAIAANMNLLKFHARAGYFAFLGFGIEIEANEEGILRSDTMDAIRQHNPQLMLEGSYYTDVLSYSTSCRQCEGIMPFWYVNRAEYYTHITILALIKEWQNPYGKSHPKLPKDGIAPKKENSGSVKSGSSNR
jgi:hypothetical protein